MQHRARTNYYFGCITQGSFAPLGQGDRSYSGMFVSGADLQSVKVLLEALKLQPWQGEKNEKERMHYLQEVEKSSSLICVINLKN